MILLIILLFICSNVQATTVNVPTTYSTNGQVTATNLNGNFDALESTLNGGLDNTNANTTSGYRFFETKSSLPTAGSQGRVIFLTTDNSLNFDNGSTFSKSVSVSSPSANDVPVYNGSAWVATSKDSVGVPSGVIVMWSGTVATIPSGWYLCDGSNGTPDLRDKFIVGAKQDSGGVAKTNISGSLTQSGGSATYDLSHTHNVNNSAGLYTDGGAVDGGISRSATSFSNIIGNTISTNSGGSSTQSVLNPYYALAFIMKS